MCVCVARHGKAKWSRSSAWIGSHELQKSSVRYKEIMYVIPHPDYQKKDGIFLNDIALVKLKKKIDFQAGVQPVSLPSVDEAFDSSSECWITGWGYTGTKGKFCIYQYLLKQTNTPRLTMALQISVTFNKWP
ncbi:trypsin-like serine protease [Paraclostridium dentum]|uniref:trypsin-like serine protease n=1 Tax=Paraclostridium dentum TaxID=2662455 RepID=UPI003F325D0A